jgi:hypothetical protein
MQAIVLARVAKGGGLESAVAAIWEIATSLRLCRQDCPRHDLEPKQRAKYARLRNIF